MTDDIAGGPSAAGPEDRPRSAPTGTPAPTGAEVRRGPLRYGDKVQLTDPRGRLHTITLAAGATFHTHKGYFAHEALVGEPEGSVVRNTAGIEYVALRPLLSDYVLSMPRGAAVIYPKDAGQIVGMADIYPGARVVEAGVGSGALTMSLLRAVGDGGSVHSIERREDFAAIARGNVETFFGGPHPAWDLSVGDLADVLPTIGPAGSVDRIVLDMLAPWENVGVVADALAPGECSSATWRPRPSSPGSPRTCGRTAGSPSRAPGSRWSAAGTSRASRCGRSTAWSATPGS
ncbi:hypothetical protein GCM10025865_28090 [Paraoerskovia sediminicola]|uniref:tRNA (adenine(58)-N(1))-methyltransferase catalytic subunit TRM61 C-terminal domain-containing protein n=1 Tax=Paraoerskovia sediminicola TaxID=1138587 RepID=A0ABM8G5R5_9CELL|nr:hypothetical protein GCM10025865_28090 [Paraoerskovia sediminicola]